MSDLSVSALTKSFGEVDVLRGIDLEVAGGDFVAVLGPSGCGKTTFLRIVAGFEHADSGTISMSGSAVAGPELHVSPEQRRIGFVPQEGALFPHLSVADNVGFGLPRGERRTGSRIDEVLELIGLRGARKSMPHELSGGQQQRVAVARALAPKPSLILLDEPFSALDSALRAGLRADVRAALKAAGATAILVTHDQQEALSISDAVAVIRAGRIVQSAPPAEVYDAPADIGVATFVGETVVVDGRSDGTSVQCAFGQLDIKRPLPGADGDVVVVIRPEQVVLTGISAAATTAVVVEQTYLGHDTVTRLRLAGGAIVTARALGRLTADAGDVVGVVVRGPVSCFPAPADAGAAS